MLVVRARALDNRARLARRLAQLVPTLAVRVVRLVLRLAAAWATHVLAEHQRDGQDPVGHCPLRLGTAQNRQRRYAPLASRPDRDLYVMPPRLNEEPRDKGART